VVVFCRDDSGVVCRGSAGMVTGGECKLFGIGWHNDRNVCHAGKKYFFERNSAYYAMRTYAG
jgi:hypothetical protein